MRIEICGGIASGKTTLAGLVAGDGIAPLYEQYQDNPFLNKFYSNAERYAFETEITYLLQHFSQLNDAAENSCGVADYSLALDLAYAEVTLGHSDRRTFESVLDRVVAKIGLPGLVVRLVCDASVEVQRIRERKRSVEQGIRTAYLDALDVGIERALGSRWFREVRVLSIDSQHHDFRPGGDDSDAVRRRVLAAMDR